MNTMIPPYDPSVPHLDSQSQDRTGEPPLLTAQDVARIVGKSTEWVHTQARTGAIPHRKVGRSYRFTSGDVRAYLDSVRAGQTQQNPWGLAAKSASRRRRAS